MTWKKLDLPSYTWATRDNRRGSPWPTPWQDPDAPHNNGQEYWENRQYYEVIL